MDLHKIDWEKIDWEPVREGDRLFAQLTGQPKLEIFPKSEAEFFRSLLRQVCEAAGAEQVGEHETIEVESMAGDGPSVEEQFP